MTLRFSQTTTGSTDTDYLPYGIDSVTFGLEGDDILYGLEEGTSFPFVMGGSGSDTYRPAGNASTFIFDTSGAEDKLIAKGIGLHARTSWSAIIDQRHLAIGDAHSGQIVYIADWLNPDNKIEYIELANGLFTSDFLAVELPHASNFLGYYTWETLYRAGLFSRIGSEVNDAMAHYAGIEKSLSQTAYHSTYASESFTAEGYVNTVQYQANHTAVSVSIQGNTSTTYQNETADYLTDIDYLQFNDGKLALDIDGAAGQTYRLYQAAFGRTPDSEGLKYWIEQSDNNLSLSDMAGSFIGSAEFQSLYGDAPSNEDFVNQLYLNVLGREGEAAGAAYWVGVLDNGMTKSDVLIGFSESSENIAGVAPAIENGIWLG